MQTQSRRSFIASSSVAGLSIAASSESIALDPVPAEEPVPAPGKRIRIANIGCGGRGTFVADIFKESGGYEITAAADYFADKVNAFGEKYGIPADRRFTGLDGYKKLLASPDIDAVAIHSPAWFHPEHTAAAVEAGKHVFVAKPIAVDVPGTLSFEQIIERAKEKKVSVLVDVQCRGNEIFQEAMKRVHAGALGDFTYGQCIYENAMIPNQAPDDGKPENRLKNWVLHKDYSGDIIVEQEIHSLDIMAWALGKPLRATGHSARKVRKTGDTADHYAVLYEWENGAAINFSGRQYNAWGAPSAITNRIFGTKGVLLTEFGGDVMIRGNEGSYYRGGKTEALYKRGSENNARSFREAILAGTPHHSTVPEAITTNLTCILGRMAAEKGSPVTWDEMLKTGQKIVVNLEGLTV